MGFVWHNFGRSESANQDKHAVIPPCKLVNLAKLRRV